MSKPKQESSASALQRPPAFTYDDVLRCERVPLPRLAEQYGTPLYVYSGTMIRERFRTFDEAFGSFPHTVCYSVKANPNLSILKLLARLGSGFDVVSGGELDRVLLANRRAAGRVVFSGVGKTGEEMEAALRAGILMFNVESEGELARLAETAGRLRRRARVALRVNPDVPAETHPYIATGLHQHKFGVPITEARGLYASAEREKWLQVAGVSVHIGSQITSVEPFSAAMQRVAELVRQLASDGHHIRYVDAGGGLGICYNTSNCDAPDFPAQAFAYARAVMSPLKSLGIHLLLEPGRSIVGPAGALLVRVLYVKHNDHKRFVVVDGAMNDLIRPALYGAHHEIAPVEMRSDVEVHGATLALRHTHRRMGLKADAIEVHVPHLEENNGAQTEVVDVVGPICETGDFFARDRELPPVRPGDLLAILDAGAYGSSISSNYNSRPRPAEVMVEGTRVRLVRRREKIKDLVRKEM